MSILDYFPSGYSPTDIQKRVLVALQHRWNNAEVFVLNLDVASGKTYIAHTIAEWRKAQGRKTSGARILTPTTVLVNQCAKDFPQTPVARSAGHYTCEVRQRRCGAYQAKDRCRGCLYTEARDIAKESPISISTYHMNMVLKSRREVVIIDEAHRIPSAIRDMHKKRIFPHKVMMPRECIGNLELTKEWAESLDISQFTKTEQDFLENLVKDMTDRPLHCYDWGTDFWSNGGFIWGDKVKKGEPHEVPTLNRQPLDIFNKPPIFWQEGQKLVLMSATIGRPDLYELGLDNTRPIFIQGDAPITPDRNPIKKDYIGNINHANQEKMLKPLADKILHSCQNFKGKGVIHTTYGLAKLLKPLLSHDRLITHTSANMRSQLKKFLRSENGIFLVSGMYEGVSLDYDKADWQVITKIAWPSLTDPLQQHRAEDEPDYYLWSTLKNVIQTAGRVCRRPDDYGETIVWDSSFERLLIEGKHLVPKAFKKRIE
jgi:Rad3-related DNA helicase